MVTSDTNTDHTHFPEDWRQESRSALPKVIQQELGGVRAGSRYSLSNAVFEMDATEMFTNPS